MSPVKLPGWGSRDHPKRQLETTVDMAYDGVSDVLVFETLYIYAASPRKAILSEVFDSTV